VISLTYHDHACAQTTVLWSREHMQ